MKPETEFKKGQNFGKKTPASNNQLMQAYNEMFFKYALGGVIMINPTKIEKNLKLSKVPRRR